MKNQKLLEIIEIANKEVRKIGYNDTTIEKYSRVWRRLMDFCKENNFNYYTIDIGNDFLEKKYNLSKKYTTNVTTRNAYRSIMILNSCLFNEPIEIQYIRSKTSLTTIYKKILDEYLLYCEKNLYNKKQTIQNKKNTIIKFFHFLQDEEIIDFNTINSDLIYKYFKNINYMDNKTIIHNLHVVRNFFLFLFETKKTKINLTYLIPTIRGKKGRKIPSVWKKEDVKKLIDSIDRNNPIGKRDYAIVLLVAKLGIRIMDVRHLTFDNIDWKKKELNFIQSKTQNIQNLPLPRDVGWAIIDYIKNGRPICDTKVIFVRHYNPIQPFSDNNALQDIIKKYMKIAKINFDNETHKKGMHTLRHSLATNLLKNNIPSDIISLILGHDNKNSVTPYLKIDIDSLKVCCGRSEDYDI